MLRHDEDIAKKVRNYETTSVRLEKQNHRLSKTSAAAATGGAETENRRTESGAGRADAALKQRVVIQAGNA